MSKFSLLVVFCFFLAWDANSQVLENYDGQWNSARAETWLGSNDQVELEVDLSAFPESELRIQIPSQSTMFVDGRLWILTKGDTVFYRKTRELKSEFGTEKVSFIVVSPYVATSVPSVRKVLGRVAVVNSDLAGTEEENPQRFVAQSVKDFYFTALVITLIFVALYKLAYPYLLAVLVQPLAVINAEDFSDSGNLQKFFSFDILFFLLIVGMMISQGAVTGLVVYRKVWLETWIGIDFSALMLLWVIGSLAIMILTILKFVGIRVVSYLFDLGKAEFSHFFYLLRLIVFGITIMILIGAFMVANNFSGLESVYGVLVTGFFWFYILGVGGLFLIMMSRLSFKKYHLFTYLCIAELVPFLILSKWIMVLGQ